MFLHSHDRGFTLHANECVQHRLDVVGKCDEIIAFL
jgi:hypothetical protein